MGLHQASSSTLSYHSLSSQVVVFFAAADCRVLTWWIIWMESCSLVPWESRGGTEEFCAVPEVTVFGGESDKIRRLDAIRAEVFSWVWSWPNPTAAISQKKKTDVQQPVSQQANTLDCPLFFSAKFCQSAPSISAWLSACVCLCFSVFSIYLYEASVRTPGRRCGASPRGPSLSSAAMRCVKCEMSCRAIHTCCAHGGGCKSNPISEIFIGINVVLTASSSRWRGERKKKDNLHLIIVIHRRRLDYRSFTCRFSFCI